MQYLDDTLIFVPDDYKSLIHLNRILRWFELVASKLLQKFFDRNKHGWWIYNQYGKCNLL
jgi:hypothetical protein